MPTASSATKRGQRGAYVVEFALCLLTFVLFLAIAIEVGRMVFLSSTIADVVRQTARQAARSSVADGAALPASLMPRNSAGLLPLGGGIDPSYLRIEYLDHNRSPVAALPDCPAANLLRCAENPSGGSCVRFVRVSLCQPGGATCTPVPYQPLFAGLLPGGGTLPTFQATVPAQSLGLRAAATCP